MEYKIYSIYYDNEITVDGTLVDQIWQKTKPVELSYFDGKELPDYLKTKVRSFWTKNNIYISFEGKFDIARTSPPDTKPDELGKTMNLWDLSDVYEIFIGPNSKETKKYRELQVAPDSRWIDLTLDAGGPERQADFKWTSGMTVKSTVDRENKIWIGVFKIPNSAFDSTPAENKVWNCNFYRLHGELGNKDHISWSPVFIQRFHLPDRYGDIKFVKE
jgi:hypothetical protein